MKKNLPAAAMTAVAVFLAYTAQAGVIVQQQERQPGSSNPAGSATLYVEAGKLRMETKGPQGEDTAMIFDQAKQVMWMVDRKAGTYYEMTAADVQKMGQGMGQAMGQMSEMMKQMEAEMANMPPEQRAMMEQMMKQQMGGMGGMGRPGAAPQITVQDKGQNDKVGPYTCSLYDVMAGGQRTQEVCAAPLDQALLQQPEYQTFQAMADFYEPLRRNLPQGGWGVSGASQIQGFPVRWRSYQGNQVTSEWEVVKAERQNLDPALFTLPSGLKKQDMMQMMQGPGR
ncbi:MAG: DUF4412 domain-containing protein [Acidobacteria bacterium]|nr:DUF4412 domain-containing protein [Acidobacteriota bacterium]